MVLAALAFVDTFRDAPVKAFCRPNAAIWTKPRCQPSERRLIGDSVFNFLFPLISTSSRPEYRTPSRPNAIPEIGDA